MATAGRDTTAALYAVIGEALGVAPASLSDASSPATVATWDSLRSIMLVTALEERYGVSFTLTDIMGINSIADVKTLLARYGTVVDG